MAIVSKTRLLSWLNRTDLVNTNNQLYELIRQLINNQVALEDVITAIDSGNIMANATIISPLGPNTAANSVSVTLTPEQIPLPISGIVDQGVPAVVANAWPIQVTDGVDTAQVIDTTAGFFSTNVKGLVTQSVTQLQTNSGTVEPWIASAGYATFASSAFPWVKAMRSFHNVSEVTLSALAAELGIDLRERSLESIAFFTRFSNLIGTFIFASTPGSSGNAIQVYNVRTAQWQLGVVTDPVDDTLYLIPAAGLQSVSLVITAYTSGSIAVSASGGPGNSATYSNVSGSHIKISDGTDTAAISSLGALSIEPIKSSVATQTQVPDSATNVTILAANSSRLGASIVNTSTVILYLRLSASAATVSNFTVSLASGGYYEIPYDYVGAISGIWASDPNTGDANVTEFTV